jgi:hypothetical protein
LLIVFTLPLKSPNVHKDLIKHGKISLLGIKEEWSNKKKKSGAPKKSETDYLKPHSSFFFNT